MSGLSSPPVMMMASCWIQLAHFVATLRTQLPHSINAASFSFPAAMVTGDHPALGPIDGTAPRACRQATNISTCFSTMNLTDAGGRRLQRLQGQNDEYTKMDSISSVKDGPEPCLTYPSLFRQHAVTRHESSETASRIISKHYGIWTYRGHSISKRL